jgi:hypothetical protein
VEANASSVDLDVFAVTPHEEFVPRHTLTVSKIGLSGSERLNLAPA